MFYKCFYHECYGIHYCKWKWWIGEYKSKTRAEKDMEFLMSRCKEVNAAAISEIDEEKKTSKTYFKTYEMKTWEELDYTPEFTAEYLQDYFS